MLTPDRSPSMDSPTENNIRKRVCKACDRCRLKKSKCDGSSPCGRCKADNAICVFGERKKSHDKVYPKGYVEMLEQQQNQLVAGLRELYRRLQTGEGWPGLPLSDQQGGHPLTHDILERLDLLQPKDGNGQYEPFEEDFARMEKRLRDEEETLPAPPSKRRGSIGSESDHGHISTPSSNGTPPTPPRSHFDPFPANNTLQTPPPTMSSLASQQYPLGSAPMKPIPMYERHCGLQQPPELMRPSFHVDAPVMDDSLGGVMSGTLEGGYMEGKYMETSFDPYAVPVDYSDHWVSSINPSALQSNWAPQFV
ncbi:uncharacterized protein J3D65DRAFT_548914 [Phyllosticta citribraziliensis]|uniref:Zn(2)-C6 fungal-type domain-containing protein n=1 Tax=Phyllosticta citribraziliensis TaxID=989973 RepID=A0ABR1LZT6_9PEZI